MTGLKMEEMNFMMTFVIYMYEKSVTDVYIDKHYYIIEHISK